MTTSRGGRWRMGVVALAALAVGSGCDAPSAETNHPSWPEAPEPARVVHRKNVRQASDLARPAPFSELGRLLLGDASPSLLRPHGVAVDSGKHLYVTDQERQGVIVFDMQVAGAKLINRVGDTFFVSPVGVAACGENFAVSDSALNKVFVMTPAGKLVSTVTTPEGFGRPTGLAYDRAKGQLYVADTLANEVCTFDLGSGRLLRRLGKRGTDPGQFNMPTHLCLDQAGRLYVSDSMNFRVQIFSPEGKLVSQIGRLGDASGFTAVPKGVAVDSLGHIYLVDSLFSAVQVFDLKGEFLLNIGGKVGGEPGQFHVPAGLAVDADNRIYVCDTQNGRVQILQYVGDVPDAQKKSPQ
ncbi:MAG: SMP-30/gluconolactonase/LRE family protein [Planctomycetota bacterium]|nr:SMP-30/gluconolactonase/LRE family protein [Planctomycetota bacterium]